MSDVDSWFRFFGLIIGFQVLTENFGFISQVKISLVSQITDAYSCYQLILILWLIIGFQVLSGFISQFKIWIG